MHAVCILAKDLLVFVLESELSCCMAGSPRVSDNVSSLTILLPVLFTGRESIKNLVSGNSLASNLNRRLGFYVSCYGLPKAILVEHGLSSCMEKLK